MFSSLASKVQSAISVNSDSGAATHTRPIIMPSSFPFSSVLVANRGEIALRLIRAIHSLDLHAVAVFVADDSTSPHIRAADVAHNLGTTSSLYSNAEAVIAAAKATGAQAVIPGYGFLSEDPDAASAIIAAGLVWLGPHPDTIRLFGLKHTARAAAQAANVPIVPGSTVVGTPEEAAVAAQKVGLPALIKASAGGGGMGQAVIRDLSDVPRQFASAHTQAESLFAIPDLFVERFVQNARHIEVQVFGDGAGHVVALGDRECSAQRRRQKVMEEAPAPGLPNDVRKAMHDASVALCAKHHYRSAGTVEFVVDADTHEWFFLEVNTRLQVEHGITELVLRVDIAAAMILLGGGVDVMSSFPSADKSTGVAIQARIYAENPVKDYIPSAGTVTYITWPDDTGNEPKLPPSTELRIDRWAESGVVVSGHYDPMLGKVMAWGRTRPLAVLALKAALSHTVVCGLDVNIPLLHQILEHSNFRAGAYTTRLLSTIVPVAPVVEVIEPGLQSSLQDYPGRVGYWNIGVSPSGPMDAYAMGMANALVGNDSSACALEITVAGPTLLFHVDAVVALAGGSFAATLDDGRPVPMWTPFHLPAGTKLAVGKFHMRRPGSEGKTGGKIAYLAVRGGFDAPKYLGSASTFPTGKFGGIKGDFLKSGDFLPIGVPPLSGHEASEADGLSFRWALDRTLDSRLIPEYDRKEWTVAALNGPHATTDFLQEESLRDIWTTQYEVHHATNRLGARLIGPVPKWTRPDGGSAGLHPSNLHDYTYAPGAVNFSGNTPIVLMLDGPSLGGFVCPVTVATADFWKVAQAAPGELVRFKQVDFDQASGAMLEMEEAWDCVRYNDVEKLEKLVSNWSPWWVDKTEHRDLPAVLAFLDPAKGDQAEIKVCYRQSGDEHVLVEYGEIDLDLAYRLRVHMLMEELEPQAFVKELCPGVRSLLIRFDRHKIHMNNLVKKLKELESGVLGSVEDVVVPSRVLEMPLAFEDQWTIEAQRRYLRSVRPDAPYMPSNVEFVRRINGLSSKNDVKEIMTSAEYMVLGLGDVYLGAPCAVPVDPRHRLVTSKYNPARTYTPEGAVGIGGAYMCIYGMDSPGGYQLCGKTLPIWDNYGSVPEACRGAPRDVPWLLRFFDRVQYFPVTDEELEELRARYRKGDYPIKIREEKFSYREHQKFLCKNKKSIETFEHQRDAAYSEERQRWEKDGEGGSDAAAKHASGQTSKTDESSAKTTSDAKNLVPVTGGVAANVWAVHVEVGTSVVQGDMLLALESMKVEILVEAPTSGVVRHIAAEKGQSVAPDDILIVLEAASGDASDVRLSTLATRFTLGLADVGSVVSTASSKLGAGVTPTTEAAMKTGVAAVELSRSAREYLPLCGAPFVFVDSDSCVKAAATAGAVVVGEASTAVTAAQAVKDGAATFALIGGGRPFLADGVSAMTASDGLIDIGLTVVACNSMEAGRVLEVCVAGRSDAPGLRALPNGGSRVLGRSRTARLRIGVMDGPRDDAMAGATTALDVRGHEIVIVVTRGLDEAVDEMHGDGDSRRGMRWWRRVIQADVWDMADVLVLSGSRKEVAGYLAMVGELELCCMTTGAVAILAPALQEGALLTVAGELAALA